MSFLRPVALTAAKNSSSSHELNARPVNRLHAFQDIRELRNGVFIHAVADVDGRENDGKVKQFRGLGQRHDIIDEFLAINGLNGRNLWRLIINQDQRGVSWRE